MLEQELQDFNVFLPLVKVDYQKREIYGRMTQEIPDGVKEVMDYASSKPLFEKWSAAAQARTSLLPEANRSLGNVRLMHQPNAVGKVIGIDYLDNERAIDIGTHIVDDDAWDKVLKGVLTGFSVGGKYARKWADGGNLRYTADPAEVSLVDSPAVPTATFKLIKMDGSEELRKLGEPMLVPVSEENPLVVDTPAEGDVNPSAPPVLIAVPTHEIAEAIPVNANVPDPNLITAHGTGAVSVPQPPPPDVMKSLEDTINTLADMQKTQAIETILKTTGSRVGIARRSAEPLAPPQGAPTDLAKYADPANWSWLYDTSVRVKTAVTEFNSDQHRAKYSDPEWTVLGKRIAAQAARLLNAPYAYDLLQKTITQKKEAQNMDLNKVDLGALLSDLQRTMTAAADQIGSGDSANAQELLMRMAGKLDTTTNGVNPAAPAPAPTGSQSGATVAMLKADAPPPPEAEDEEEMSEANKALNLKVDALTKLVTQLVERETAAPMTKNTPVGDLAALLNATANPNPEIDPVIAALTSGDKYALQKAADAAGAGGRPDMDAVLQKANQAASESLAPMFTRMMLARGYTNLQFST